ncbi:MAG: TadE/TadG family type IV pilus assembly protein [Caulobacteraceae bacterium]
MLKTFGRDRSGASAVEFAVASPILFVMLFATFELGWSMQCGSSVRSAVEQASRVLISNPGTTSADLQTKAMSNLSGLPIKDLTVTVSQEWVTGNIHVARVSWDYKYTMAMPLVPDLLLDFGSSIIVPMAQA